MASKNSVKKILNHPDSSEIISKILIKVSDSDISQWLETKYPGEKKFMISARAIKEFREEALDLYQMIKDDVVKTQTAMANVDQELNLALQNNSSYRQAMVELAGNEIDIKKMLVNMITAIETRVAQVFDQIQMDPTIISTNHDRVLMEYFDRLGGALERYSKYVLGSPDQIIQHNHTVQHTNQHVVLIQETIRETLAEMDIESSLRFMEIFTEKMNRLKPPTEKELQTEQKLAEVKVLSESINDRLNSGL